MILIFLSPFNSISFLLVVFWGFLILPMFPIPLRLGFLPNRYANKGQLFVSQCLTCFWLPAHWMQNLRIALQGVKCFSFLIQTSPEGTRRLPLFVYALSLSRFDDCFSYRPISREMIKSCPLPYLKYCVFFELPFKAFVILEIFYLFCLKRIRQCEASGIDKHDYWDDIQD